MLHMSVQIFLHRAQRWGNGELLAALDDLCTQGVRAFEIDMMWESGGFCIGHPAHHKNRYLTEPIELSSWAIRRDVTVLLDIKRNDTPSFGSAEIEEFFGKLSPQHFLVASYDLPFAALVGKLSGVPPCGIVRTPVSDLSLDLILILPDRFARQLTPEYRKEKVIISGMNSLAELQGLATQGFRRFISDNLEIAVANT